MLEINVFAVINDRQKHLPFYMETVGWQKNQSHISRPSGYPYYHWLQTVNGAGKLILEGQIYTIEQGTGFLLMPHEPHEYYAIEEPWEVYWLTYDGFHIQDTMRSLGFTSSCILSLSDAKSTEEVLEEMIEEAKASDGLNDLEISSFVYKFLTRLAKYSSVENNYSLQQYYARLSPVLEYIKQHYMDDTSLDQMAACLHVTPQYLCKLFKDAFNITPFTYLIKYRIKKAKELLLFDKTMSIKEVGQAVGFSNISYFCSLFRKYEGITPGIFKEAHR